MEYNDLKDPNGEYIIELDARTNYDPQELQDLLNVSVRYMIDTVNDTHRKNYGTIIVRQERKDGKKYLVIAE